MNNPYLPYPVRIAEITVNDDERNLRTFKFEFLNPGDEEKFSYLPGQFAELSVPGQGEIPIGIASSPTEKGYLLFTVNRTGHVSTFLHYMKPGDVMGIRGPLGHPYPFEKLKGKNLVIIAGGFAVTTLRAAGVWLLDPANRANYGKISFIYGARGPSLLLFLDDFKAWEKRDDIDVFLCSYKEAKGWDGLVGFLPEVVKKVCPPADNAAVFLCGAPVVIKFTQTVLLEAGFKNEDIFLSLENRMKCGLGICGRCNVGPEYVCKDGPVFSVAELSGLPREY
ncbi:MAG: FAD/NAD(P)-binding protein [Deltaproteobacteria bacterium]|jgi:NAD(P)H-flavin reductase|nr:FAD/NAD(P)-binding protein [Deltaproteobacteria bacterium]